MVNASSSGFSNPLLNQVLNQLTMIKLDQINYLLWKILVLLILKCYKLEGHLTGEKLCPPKYVLTPGSTSALVNEAKEIEGAVQASDT
ncbi:uncharacterized protein E6C27_scaffold278G001080 [Cucumis melo var. makuwa]|nr:uncharacterized protein E6C27_scaffold278G001080 [Cucumis melo var. makuwa]